MEKNHNQKIWTEGEISILRAEALNGNLSYSKIGKLLNRSKASVKGKAVQLGIKSNHVHKGIYTKDEAFWDEPNMVNCYYAGIAASDGCVMWEYNMFAWALQEGDVKYLERFKEITKYTGKIGFQEKCGFGRKKSRQHYLHICGAKKWNEALFKNFNIIPQKAKRLEPPNLKNDLLKCCFLIGALDGDGSICFTDKTTTICITSSSLAVITWIQSFIAKNFDINTRNQPMAKVTRKSENCYRFGVNNIKAIKLFEFLRKINVPKFERKWHSEEVEKAMEEYRTKYPEIFTEEMAWRFDENDNIVTPNHPLVRKPENSCINPPDSRVIPLAERLPQDPLGCNTGKAENT
jgi:hypothetical protein